MVIGDAARQQQMNGMNQPVRRTALAKETRGSFVEPGGDPLCRLRVEHVKNSIRGRPPDFANRGGNFPIRRNEAISGGIGPVLGYQEVRRTHSKIGNVTKVAQRVTTHVLSDSRPTHKAKDLLCTLIAQTLLKLQRVITGNVSGRH